MYVNIIYVIVLIADILFTDVWLASSHFFF